MGRMSQQTESQPAESAVVATGVARGDMRDLRYQLFVDAMAVARSEWSPTTAWEAFVEVAWREVGLAFGFLEREPWPEGLERPGLPSGAEASQGP